jgi:hypothetical protein
METDIIKTAFMKLIKIKILLLNCYAGLVCLFLKQLIVDSVANFESVSQYWIILGPYNHNEAI